MRPRRERFNPIGKVVHLMDPFTIIMLVLLAGLVFFMFRNNKKRTQQQSELQSKIVPGADVMTSQGIFGTIISMDEESNKVILETTPGTLLTLHRQTIARVVEDEPETTDEVEKAPGDDLIESDDTAVSDRSEDKK